MTGRTGGGLIEFSAVVESDLLDTVEQVAGHRRANRDDTINELVRRGLVDWELEQEILRRRSEGPKASVAMVQAICRPLTDEELEGELQRRRRRDLIGH